MFASPLNVGELRQPLRRCNNTADGRFGTVNLGCAAAPPVVSRAGGSPRAVTAAIQGFVLDDDSRSAEGYSITNALIVRIE